MPARAKINWGAVDSAWRCTGMSTREIAQGYKRVFNVTISHVAVYKHYRKLGIKKGDLLPEIRKRADQKLAEHCYYEAMEKERRI